MTHAYIILTIRLADRVAMEPADPARDGVGWMGGKVVGGWASGWASERGRKVGEGGRDR